MSIQDSVIQAVSEAGELVVDSVAKDEDVFVKFDLNSMQIFSVLVKLEKRHGIVIGEDASEFERIRTFSGLCELVGEKIAAGEAPPGAKTPTT